jgi:hypothetical protein
LHGTVSSGGRDSMELDSASYGRLGCMKTVRMVLGVLNQDERGKSIVVVNGDSLR